MVPSRWGTVSEEIILLYVYFGDEADVNFTDRQARRPLCPSTEQRLLHRNVTGEEEPVVMFSNGVYAEPLTAQFSYTSLVVDNTHGSPGTSYGRAMYFSAMCKLWKNEAGCPCSAADS